jgi:alkylation response protein AidB-like acyl-CoA dehydrogenase
VGRGGGGVTHQEMGDVLRTLARDDAATALCLSMHSHLVAAQVWRRKAGMDADAVFAKVVDGAILVSTGASDWVGSSGQATRVDGGYLVQARKAPAGGCEAGQVLVTSIRWDGAPDGPQVLHCSVPMSAEGVRIEPTWDTMGMRATGSHTVVLDDVFVPDGAVSLVRPADVWHPIWNTVRRALEIVGGSGFARSSDLERLQRDVTGALFHPLPRARQAIFSGRVALGWDPAG